METMMTAAQNEAVTRDLALHGRVRDLVRAVRAHAFAIENPPDGNVDNGLNAILTLDRLRAIAEDVAEEVEV